MRRRIMVAVAAVLLLLGGCSIGDIRRPPPPPPPPAPTQPAFEVHRGSVPVPPGYALQNVEFVDQAVGYALFGRCGASDASPGPAAVCNAAVVRTDDAGRDWNQVYHPHPEGKGHQMYADDERLVLWVEDAGWWVSTDQGATYTYYATTPPGYRAMEGEFQACCDGPEPRRAVRFDGETMRPTPAQPPVEDLRVVARAEHWLFAVGMKRDVPVAAVSTDTGATWRPVPVAGGSDHVEVVRIEVDHDGTFAWLVGQTDLVSWPRLWFFDGQGWRPVAATGHPDRFTSAVSLEDGSLAVTTPDGPAVVMGGVFQSVDWPIGDCYLRLLEDGTLFCGNGAVSWLGVGSSVERQWTRVQVGS